MALKTFNVGSLDPNLYTGPSRIMTPGPVSIWAPALNVEYGEFARFVYIGGAGNLSITCWDGSIVVLNALEVGKFHFCGSIKINSVGTTATDILVGS